MARFEFVTEFKDCGLSLPERKTSGSAGYDLAAAADIIVPSFFDFKSDIEFEWIRNDEYKPAASLTLDQMGNLTKRIKARPTLVPTGLKCKLDPGTYLEVSARSSTPLKYWLVLANGVGIIDEDYYGSAESEGHIYLQFINFSPIDIVIKKGDIIGQGIIKPYLITENDSATGKRLGGFGSTSK